MEKPLLNALQQLIERMEHQGLRLGDERPIPYGVQVRIEDNQGQSIPLSIYFSKKKGISHVIGGPDKHALRPVIQRMIHQPVERLHSWSRWVGTDESGKGDFFGPLVVCGVLATRDDEERLMDLGIKDSKKLSDSFIRKIAPVLFSIFENRTWSITLDPIKYNELYQNFRNQGKKLNELLGWMHGRVIANLAGIHKFDGALIDKFASERSVRDSLQALQNVTLKFSTGAERDPGVAAASILARFRFITRMDDLSQRWGIQLYKGVNPQVIDAGKAFISRWGIDKLNQVAKLHFKTINKIR